MLGAAKSARRTGRELPGGFARWRRLLNRLLPDNNSEKKKCQARLFQAGIYDDSALLIYFLAKLLMMGVPPLIGCLAVWSKQPNAYYILLWCNLFGVAGMLLPSFWLSRQIAARQSALRKSLPDYLDLMIVCVEGGLSLQGSLLRVSKELQLAHPILAQEMHLVHRDIELGDTADTALRRLADRTGLESLRTLSTFVRQTLRYGTALGEALRLHADMLRNQRRQVAEERAQKAAVKILLPMMLLILPAVFVVLAGPAAIQIQAAFAKAN